MHRASVKFWAVFGEGGESLGNYFSKQEAMAALGEYYLKRYPFDASVLELNASVEAEDA